MNGLKYALFRVIPLTTLIIAILTGLSYVLIYGQNDIYEYTFLEQIEINGSYYNIFAFQKYINAFDISNFNHIFAELDFTFLRQLSNYFDFGDYTKAMKSIVNSLIVVVNLFIWLLNFIIFCIEFIGMILYYAFTIVGFNMNKEIAWESFPVGAMINFIINIPALTYVNYLVP